MLAGAATMVRRVRYRVPVRLRQYWKPLAGWVGFVGVLVLGFDTLPVQPYVISGGGGSAGHAGHAVVRDIPGTGDLFDQERAHTISLKYQAGDYRRMVDGYLKANSKEYLAAEVTIDGTTIRDVGVRLKGNSTLTALAARAAAGQGANSRPGQQGGSRSLPLAEPENLPWLLRFDEFRQGQRYQGYREIVLRAGGVGAASSLVVNEALSLGILAAIGEIAPRHGYARVIFNDRPATMRLVVEQPGQDFASRLPGRGALYKALATGRFTYQGDDQTAYQDDFKQITMKRSQDLRPVINLIRWVETSGEAEFAEHLGDHVEVAALARYVALQDLLLNFDDMAGPGHNYYLWYDPATRRFTVIGWDYNLAFRGKASQGPRDPVTGMPATGADASQTVGHKLKDRFLATPRFQAQYTSAYRELYRQIYADGQASRVLSGIAAVLSGLHGYDQRKVTTEVDQLRLLVRERTIALAAL